MTARSSTSASRVFRTAEVARILGVPPARVHAIARAGLCQPTHHGRTLEFSFQDLVLLRTAHGLLQSAVPARRVRRALSELARQLPPGRPLSGVRIFADGSDLLVRDGRTAWQPGSGQGVFTFEVDDLARAAGIVVPAHRRRSGSPVKTPQPAYEAALWFERGLAREKKNDTAGASAAYRRALELDPEMSDAHINLGRLLHEQGDAAEAARLYHLAVECAPDDPIAHYNLAITLEDQDRTAAAISHYQSALDLDPTFADAHFNLGRLLNRLGQRTAAMRHMLLYRKLTKNRG